MWKGDIESKTIRNTAYRRVLSTTPQLQLVLMSIPAKTDIPKERHIGVTQFLRVEKGHGQAIIAGKRYTLKDGDAIVIPPQTWHRIVNKGRTPLKLYSIYSPPQHKPGLVQRNRPEKDT